MRSAFVRCFPKSIDGTQILQKNALVATAIFRNLKRCYFLTSAFGEPETPADLFEHHTKCIFNNENVVCGAWVYQPMCAGYLF